MARWKRKVGDKEITVRDRDGLFKRCDCSERKWKDCSHAWWFGFQWNGDEQRHSLHKLEGKPRSYVMPRDEAETLRDKYRQQIKAGTFKPPTRTPSPATVDVMTFAKFAGIWNERVGKHLVRPRDNDYRLAKVKAFVLPGTNPPLTFGDKPLKDITTDDIEAYRDARKATGLSAVTVNHDLKLLRKMFRWGVKKRHLMENPFLDVEGEPIKLDRELPRDKRLPADDGVQRLLDAAREIRQPLLYDVIVAMLDTCARPGEILKLKWKDVDMERRVITIHATKTEKRGVAKRDVPITSRLFSVLEMRKARCAVGLKALGGEAHVFGNEYGYPVKSIRGAWDSACAKAGLKDFHLADLRHEAGSDWLEHGADVREVMGMLGHTNLETTTRYLNTTIDRLQATANRVEAARAARAAQRKAAQQQGVAQISEMCDNGSGQTDAEIASPATPQLTVQ